MSLLLGIARAGEPVPCVPCVSLWGHSSCGNTKAIGPPEKWIQNIGTSRELRIIWCAIFTIRCLGASGSELCGFLILQCRTESLWELLRLFQPHDSHGWASHDFHLCSYLFNVFQWFEWLLAVIWKRLPWGGHWEEADEDRGRESAGHCFGRFSGSSVDILMYYGIFLVYTNRFCFMERLWYIIHSQVFPLKLMLFFEPRSFSHERWATGCHRDVGCCCLTVFVSGMRI